MTESQVRELLEEELVLKTGTKLNGKSLYVLESKNKSSDELCEFTILDLPYDSIAFTLDPDHTTLSKKKIYQNFIWLLKNEPKMLGIKKIVHPFPSHFESEQFCQ